VVTHLIALGHRRIAYVTERPELSAVQARIAAFRQAMSDHGLPVDPGLVRISSSLRTEKLDGGYAAMTEMLDEGYRPTAVCTSADLAAIGIMRALREHGLRIPDEVSVVGCDDIKQASYTDPPLATIHTPYAEITAASFRLLQHLIDPRRWQEPMLEVGHTLVMRASVAAPPAYDGPPAATAKRGEEVSA
jgi:DNA-binding LacI/PurR family transcriptional regulator